MTPKTRQKIAALRAQGLFQHQSDERVAQMLTRTAGLHARIAAASAEHGNMRQAGAAGRVYRRMKADCGL